MSIDNLESLLESRLARADCCAECGLLIPSKQQTEEPGADVCASCKQHH